VIRLERDGVRGLPTTLILENLPLNVIEPMGTDFAAQIVSEAAHPPW
jgi:hypothetical protein